jgi:hypothetical protein
LSQSAIDGFFAIIGKWQIPIERAGELLGGMPRSTVYKLKSAAILPSPYFSRFQKKHLTVIWCYG